MTHERQFDGLRGERGAALLIAIFALLLISVVGIALIVSSGTDSALARNYRTSTNAYYAALAGVEEARGRLLPTNLNYIPMPATPMTLTQVVYIINPAGGEVVAPEDTATPTTYPDTQYLQEFGVDVSTRAVTKYASVSSVAGLPGPSFKWVRINAVTERAMGNGSTGVDINNDGDVDPTTPLFFDPENRTVTNVMEPGLVETHSPLPTASQVLEITAFAVLPSGGQKMLQYIVRPLVVFPDLNMQGFHAALTLAGNNVTFTGPGTNNFYIRGQDQCGTPPPPPALPPAFFAIGYTNGPPDLSKSNIAAGATPTGNYQGMPMNSGPPIAPSTGSQTIADVHLYTDPNWLTPQGLDAVVQDITNNADAVITGPATPGSFPSGMSAAHPMTIVVNGDLDMNGWRNTGYGLLVVTGNFYYNPDATWEGVILVIGQGNFVSTRGGDGQIDGAVFIAKTRDGANNLLPSLGASSFSQTGPGTHVGQGINYNSCIARAAQGPITYKVIAFKEIPLPN
ncbi:MAG TPA: hypothetical protein VFI38_04400 [Candidatus Acidoferrum sp.]|nr:hypothetical protein [Candidatus Acidoferrum sp.]